MSILSIALVSIILISSQSQLVFADHATASVSIPAGTGVPGCENTKECWDPAGVIVDVGGEVIWSNDDSAVHTVISGNTYNPSSIGAMFDSGLLLAGDTFSHTFQEAGIVNYFCMVHPWMLGAIIVQDTEPEPVVEEFEHESEPEVVEEVEHEPEPEPEVPPPAPIGTDVIIGLGTAVPGCEETNSCFSPSTFSIDSGEYVIWYNADTAYHTVTSGDPADPNSVGAMFDSSLFGPGEAFDYQFNQSGTFPYWCIIHPWMKGTIIVEDSEPEPEVIPEPEPEVIEEPEPEVILEPSVESSTATIFVQLTKSYYNTGDIITIYGAVSKNIGGSVSIFVTSPNDNLMVFQQAKVDSANNFSTKVQTGSTIWDTSGTYTVKAQYGTSIDNEFFQYQANKLTPKSTSEYSPPIIPVPTPDVPVPQDVPAPQDDGLEQLIEDNKILREELERQGEEIDELNQEVDYLKNIIESIQGFFSSIFG